MSFPAIHLFFASDADRSGQSSSVRRFLSSDKIAFTAGLGAMRARYSHSSDELNRFVEFSMQYPDVRYVVRSAIEDEEFADETWSIICNGDCRYLYGTEIALIVLASTEKWLLDFPLEEIVPWITPAGEQVSTSFKRRIAGVVADGASGSRGTRDIAVVQSDCETERPEVFTNEGLG